MTIHREDTTLAGLRTGAGPGIAGSRQATGVLVHEWIARSGGSENVLQAMSETYPEADIHCLWDDSSGRFDRARVRESWLARTPLRHHKALALLAMPAVWRARSDAGYDWALISSHAFAHHVRFRGARADLRRLVYVHTPARYVWTRTHDARGDQVLARVASRLLRPLDRRRAREGAEFAANSDFVRRRIVASWGVEARVIHPPVDVELIQAVQDWRDELTDTECSFLDLLPGGFVLGASRFIPYKRLEDVIRVGEVLRRPVVLAGRGPHRRRLEEVAATATVPVVFVDAPSRAMLHALYQATALYVFPAVEDFGIMPVEAMAAGAPVLAQAEGGAAESVVCGVTGALATFDDDDEIRRAAAVAMDTLAGDRRERAKAFSLARFQREIAEWVGQA